MKKAHCVFRAATLGLAALVCLSVLSACEPKVYNDGTYRAVSAADDLGYATAEVSVLKDKIVSVTLAEFDGYGVEKTQDSYAHPPAKEAGAEMAERFAGSEDANVDVYAGATKSSRKYKQAVSFALEKAKMTSTVMSTYFDGTFQGSSGQTEDGYQMAWVTIEDDKITSVILNQVTPEGQFRDWLTYPNTTVLEAKDAMEKAFVEKGDPVVDVFAGATKSSTGWIEAVNDALTKAKVR